MNPLRHPLTIVLLLAGACAPAMAQLSDAQRSAIKSACRGDYMSVCASVPTGTQASLQCLQQHSTQVSSACQSALAAAPVPIAAASAATADAATPTPAAAVPAAAAPMTQADKARLLRKDCGGDFEKFCAGVPLGGGRGSACLKAHAGDLSPSCTTALMSAAPAH